MSFIAPGVAALAPELPMSLKLVRMTKDEKDLAVINGLML
jgi:hypothetical protein